VWLLVALGVVVLAAFFGYARARERGGRTPLISPSLFRNRTSNLGLLTQHVQWLVLQGVFFVISVFLQQERGYSAIQTGLMLVPATIGILLSSGLAQRMASRHPQRVLIRVGFTLTVAGIVLLLLLARADSANWTYWPGLFLMGFGVGAMLTASVNVVQSAWPEEVQGDISGVSRSVSNLGSSLGVAIAGSVLVAATAAGNAPFLTAIVVVGAFAIVGWVAALLLPRQPQQVPAA
jgi:predicted MFS family arabinose efflux permease